MSAQSDIDADERDMRRSFRVRESAFVHYQKLDDSQYAHLLETRALQTPSDFGNHARLVNLEATFQEQFALMGTAATPVRECMRLLNEKLNLLLDEQPERQKTMQKLSSGRALTCEIGTTGIRFDSVEQLPVGTKLFLQIMLTADRHYLETPAVVRREVSTLNELDDNYGVAAEFVGFSEAESELLIKHLFQRENASLRMRRVKEDHD